MATTIGRMITLATSAPEIFAAADEAGPELREMMALATRLATLMKSPGLLKLTKIAERVIRDLDLGGAAIPAAEIVTPKEAIERIAAGDISPAEKAQMDRASQTFG